MLSEQELEAYEMAKFWRGTGYGLDYWQSEVEAQIKTHGWKTLVEYASEWRIKPEEIVEDDEYEEENEEEDDLEDDEDMREAIRLSRKSHSATPSASPPAASLPQKRSELIIIEDGDSDDSLYKRPRKKSRSRRSPERSHYAQNRDRAHLFSTVSSHDERHPKRYVKAYSHKKQKETRSRFSGGMDLDRLLGRSSLGQPSAVPTSDTVEGRM